MCEYNDLYENSTRQIEAKVTLTLSKIVKVNVDDYIINDSGVDEDGIYYEDVDYSVCDLNYAVQRQIILPNNAWKYIDSEKQASKDLKDWDIEEFHVENYE